MRMYKPLIDNALPQMPPSRLGTGPGFVTDSFLALRPVTAVELRIGSVFSGQTAKHLHRSLSEIAQVIRNMPANYLRWPASDHPIFEVTRRRMVSTPAQLQIDEAFLWSLGDFRIPLDIWQALTHYNVWIEPVLVSEWVRLVESYCNDGRPDIRTLAHALLAWVDPARDTSFARAAVDRIRGREAGLLRMVGHPAARRVRRGSLLPLCRVALWGRMEPDAGRKANQHPEVEPAGHPGGSGARQRYHQRMVERSLPEPK
jgi:hypothetical protein